MTRHIPRVSIGLPVYNGENYLEAALVSLLSQTFTDFELIINDNASTDRTQEICHTYATQDARIRTYRSEINRGAAWNFNRVFHLARGEYFKWAAHDDLIKPTFLQECVRVLDDDPAVILCFCYADVIDATGKVVTTVVPELATNSPDAYKRYRDLILNWHGCLDVFGLMRTDILRQTPLIGSYAVSDRVLLADLGLRGRFHHIAQPLFTSRVHTAQSSQVHLHSGTDKIDLHDYTAWFDAAKTNKIVFPQWRLLLNYARAAQQTNLPFTTRVLCHFYLARWSINCGPSLLRDVAHGARQFLQLPRKNTQVSPV